MISSQQKEKISTLKKGEEISVGVGSKHSNNKINVSVSHVLFLFLRGRFE
jgi:hypothetical protein